MRADRTSRENSVVTSDVKKEFTQFLQHFPSEEHNQPKYMALIQRMIDTDKHQLVVDYQDFISFSCELANLVFDEYYKY